MKHMVTQGKIAWIIFQRNYRDPSAYSEYDRGGSKQIPSLQASATLAVLISKALLIAHLTISYLTSELYE